MLARRAGIDLNDGHALLAAIVSALAHPRPATGAPLSSARRAAANPSRAISHRSYSTTTAIASSIPSRTRSSAPEQAHADEARRRFCDLAVRERLAEGRDAGYEGPIASTSAVTLDSPAPQLSSATPPPAAAAAHRPSRSTGLAATSVPHHLLESVRSAPRLTPTTSPSALLASQRPILYDDESDAQHPPTPPPPIAFLPQADRTNPHLLSAALLQAIFLGASAMGLLMRKRVRNDGGTARAGTEGVEEEILDDMVVQQRWATEELATRRKEGEFALGDVPALNLLLSAYAEVDSDLSVDGHQSMTKQLHKNEQGSLLRQREADLEQVNSLLARFDNRRVKPDQWTVLAVLAFANPKVPLTSDVLNRGALGKARLELNHWAWKAYAACGPAGRASSSTITPEAHLAILHTFIQFLDSPLAESLSPSVRHKRITSIASRLVSASSNLPTPPPALLLQVGLLALEERCTDIVTSLLIDSTLPPRERQSLALAVLEAASVDEDWRQNRDLVCFLAETLVGATTELCETLPKEELDIPLVERASQLLVDGFGVDVPLEPFFTSLILAPLRLPDGHLHFSPEFLPSVLSSLINARHPSSAYKLISPIPRSLRTTKHYYPLLRSHHRRTASDAWQELQERWTAKEIKPEVEAWEARLSGFIKMGSGGGMAPSQIGPSTRVTNRRRAKEALAMAQEDLLLLQKQGIPRSIKLSNKLLRLSSRASGEKAWRRHVARQWRDAEGEVEGEGEGVAQSAQLDRRRSRAIVVGGKVDETTRAIMLGRYLQGSERGPRSNSYGRKQMREVRDELKEGEAMMQRRFGRKEGRREEEQQDKVDILPNLVLTSLTRWPREITTSTLVKLARQSLNIDLKPNGTTAFVSARASSPPATLLGVTVDSQPIPTLDQFNMLRRPAYRTLLKAFRNRGERTFHRALMERLQVEERWVRRKAMGLK